MEKRRPVEKIYERGEEYESKYFELIAKVTIRLLHGFFHFKKRKGELLAGAATFFAILSFCPVILLFISLAGMVMGDINAAKDFVLEIVNSNFPHLAPWIFESIKKIVENQLSGASSTNIFNIFLLLYACLGVVASLIFGLHYTSKTEAKGGFIIEDFKSIGIGLVFTSFLFSLLILSNKNLVFSLVHLEPGMMKNAVEMLFKGAFLPSVVSLGFFTAFYKWSMHVPVRTKDAFLGAASFVTCFMVGKSFHWVYIKVARETLTQSYGNFETMIIAVLWVYFLMCSFFYGASVAHASYSELSTPAKVPESLQAPSELVAVNRVKKSA